MATNAPTTKSEEMSAEEMKEYLEAKAMLERNKDRIMQDTTILAFKYRQALKQTPPRK